MFVHFSSIFRGIPQCFLRFWHRDQTSPYPAIACTGNSTGNLPFQMAPAQANRLPKKRKSVTIDVSNLFGRILYLELDLCTLLVRDLGS